MKVAYLVNQYPKTSHTFIRREIAGVEAAGIDVERVSVRATRETLVDERDEAESKRTRVLLGRGVRGLLRACVAVALERPWSTVRALRKAVRLGRGSPRGVGKHLAYLAEAALLLRWTRELGVEHIHAHFSTNPATVALLCRALGGPPFSFTAHGTADFEAAKRDSLAGKIAAATFVVAVSEDGKKRLSAQTAPGHETKLRVVRCGVDGQFLSGSTRGVPDAKRLTCVARLSEEKGVATLVRATALLAKDDVEVELVLVGDGPERAELERLARDLGVARRVRFDGWRSSAEVRERLLASRALVLASRSEGLPVVIMEAMALARPVIATDVGGIAELVVHEEPEKNGWLVPPGDERALASAMRDVLERAPSELDAMGRRGAARVAAMHDASAEACKLAELFRHGVRRAEPSRGSASKPRGVWRPNHT